MSKYRFKPSERYAVFTVQGEVCYLCREPIDMATFQVDHVIPEHLSGDPEQLDAITNSYGLPDNFDLNSFENWMPACQKCNNRKRAAAFEALPIIAVELQKCAEKADQAREIEAEVRTTRQIARAVTIIETATQQGDLDEVVLDRLKPLLDYHEVHRTPETNESPLRIGPGVELIKQDGGVLTIRGPYGVGVGRVNPPEQGGFRCPVCGHSAWNGARCVVCGTLDDD